ncbi:MAG: homing endonuclease [Parcubacteria group bacterium Gr01-1014_66]|nr:MAG: homing endonuclease [Parcubacteria group bacterium Gr01-1014_66]
MRSIGDYITGYVDGEGCFMVTFNKRPAMQVGWELRPSFSVSQNEDRRQVLDLIRDYFGCGYIRRDFSDETVKFEIRDHGQLMTKVIPHFQNYPFFSAKQKDFKLFAHICLMIDKKKHLTPSGFAEIVELAYRMNGSGKRKRIKEEIINNLIVHQDEDIVLSLSQDKAKRSSEAHERRNDWGTVSTRSPVKIQYR